MSDVAPAAGSFAAPVAEKSAPVTEKSGPVAEKSAKKARSKRYTRPSICLDYLKGQCVGRRFQCKYLHPDLTEFQHQFGALQPGEESPVCEVWALTGHCKFGARCNKQHPPIPRDEAGGDGAVKGLLRLKLLRDTDLEVVNAEGGMANGELEFDDLFDSLLCPFRAPATPAADVICDPAPSKAAPHGKLDDLVEANLAALLKKPHATFDSVFMDILSDLHLVSA